MYPPMKPMGIRYRQYGLQFVRVIIRAKKSPIRNEPLTLMTNVPYGKRAPILLPMKLPNQKRSTDPKQPPTPTITYFSKSLPSRLTRVRQFRRLCKPKHKTPAKSFDCQNFLGLRRKAPAIHHSYQENSTSSVGVICPNGRLKANSNACKDYVNRTRPSQFSGSNYPSHTNASNTRWVLKPRRR